MLDRLVHLLRNEPFTVLVALGAAMLVSAVLQYALFLLGRRLPGLTSLGELLRWVTRPLLFLLIWCGLYTLVMLTMPVGKHWYAAAIFALFVSILAFGFLLTAVKRV